MSSGITSLEGSYSVICRELAFQLADQFRALGAGITLKVSAFLPSRRGNEAQFSPQTATIAGLVS